MTVFFYGCITLDGYLATKERRMSGDGDDGIFSMSGDGAASDDHCTFRQYFLHRLGRELPI